MGGPASAPTAKGQRRSTPVTLTLVTPLVTVLGALLLYQNCGSFAPADPGRATAAPTKLAVPTVAKIEYHRWNGDAGTVEITFHHDNGTIEVAALGLDSVPVPCAADVSERANDYRAFVNALSAIELQGNSPDICTAVMRDSVDVQTTDGKTVTFGFSACDRLSVANDAGLQELLKLQNLCR